MSAARPIVDVAVGIVIRPADGWILIGQRPAGKPFEGWWEFPGGKFEPGETPAQATARELDEELGIQVGDSQPWVVREHVYAHAHVRLHFRRVTDWQGEPQSREGQAFVWCHPAVVDVEPLLPASRAPIGWLGLPSIYAISDATAQGIAPWLAGLTGWLGAWQAAGEGRGAPPLLLLREPGMDDGCFAALFEAVMQRVRGTGVRVLVSSRHPHPYARRASDETGGGIHLTAADLHAVAEARPRQGARPASGPADDQGGARQQGAAVPPPAGETGLHTPDWRAHYQMVGASCHTTQDLQRAGAIEADLAVCGPVLPTRSHPGAVTQGWTGLAAIIAHTPVPVYALGGLKAADLDTARQAGAQGVAMQRAVWGA